MSCRVSRPMRPPSGFTLLEMLLVLGLLVVLAAVSWPALRKPLASRRLRQAGQAVRIEIARARLEAMRSGQEQGLVYVPNGGKLRRFSRPEEFDPDAEAGALGSTAVAAGSRDPIAHPRGADPAAARWEEVQLPEPIRFGEPSPAEFELRAGDALPVEPLGLPTPRDGEAVDSWWSDGGESEPWSEPIWFHADGTASDAELRLQNEQGESLRVHVRGLTGTALCDEPVREELPP